MHCFCTPTCITGLLPQFTSSLRTASAQLAERVLVICATPEAHAACTESSAKVCSPLCIASAPQPAPRGCCPNPPAACAQPARSWPSTCSSSASRLRRMQPAPRARPSCAARCATLLHPNLADDLMAPVERQCFPQHAGQLHLLKTRQLNAHVHGLKDMETPAARQPTGVLPSPTSLKCCRCTASRMRRQPQRAPGCQRLWVAGRRMRRDG